MPRERSDPARYRASEERFWASIGRDLPDEHWIELASVRARVRLLASGDGPTLLLVHGGPSAASKWAPLVKRLPDFRCLLLERPGCGLSELPRAGPRRVRAYVTQMVDDALAALDSEPAAIVASSFGSFCVLGAALARPDRMPRVIHMGCPALVPGVRTPLSSVLPALPGAGAVVRALQAPSFERSRRAFESMGHAPSVLRSAEATAFLEWYTALMRHTETRANDSRLFGRVRPGDALSTRELGEIDVPTSFFWGADDSFGDAAVAGGIVEALPSASLEILADGGHLPWLDAPDRAAEHVRSAVA